MKNLYIIDDYASSKSNGIGTYIKELIYCLKETEIDICHIACCHDSKTFKIEVNNGIKQMQFPVVPYFFVKYYSILDKFFRLYIDDSPENVFLFNHTPNEFFVRKIKFSFPKSKLVFVIHDMIWTEPLLGNKTEIKKLATIENLELFEKEYPILVSRFKEEKNMFDTIHQIVALAQETVELLQSTYNINNENISFIANGLQDNFLILSKGEKNQLKVKLFIPINEKVIVFAGRTSNSKGIYRIINSLRKVVRVYPNFRLIVIGTIFEVKKLMEYTSEIAPKITFTGQISKDKLYEWYQIADIGVLSSYWEQCSYTGIEMMMHGLPVVASDGFCVGDMFKDNLNAKIAKIGDRNCPEEFENNLSEAFLELLKSPNLCKKLGNNGRKIYESKYHINCMEKGYQMLLDSL